MGVSLHQLLRLMSGLIVSVCAWFLQPSPLNFDSNPATFILFLVAVSILIYRLYWLEKISNSGTQHIYIQLILMTGGMILLASRFSPDFQDMLFIFGAGTVFLGLTFVITGIRSAALLLFPIFVLYGLIPLLSVADAILSFPMRRLSALLASYILYPWFDNLVISGTELIANGITVSVTAACDGLTLFQNMLWIGWLYLLSHQSVKRLPLSAFMAFFSAVLLANSLRVAVLFMASHWWGISILTSEWHDIVGWFAVALAVMIFILMDKATSQNQTFPLSDRPKFG